MGKEKHPKAAAAKKSAAVVVDSKRDAAPTFKLLISNIPALVDGDVMSTKCFFENLFDFSEERKFRLTLHFDEDRNFLHTMTLTAFTKELAEELFTSFNGWEVRSKHNLAFTRLYK